VDGQRVESFSFAAGKDHCENAHEGSFLRRVVITRIAGCRASVKQGQDFVGSFETSPFCPY